MPIELTPLDPTPVDPDAVDASGAAYDFSTQTSEESDSNGLIEIPNVPYGAVYQLRWGWGPWITVQVNTTGDSQQVEGLSSGVTA